MCKRNWSAYNESLIERGHILMDIGFIKSQRRELTNMNKKKVGRPFLYPDSYVEFLAFIKIAFSISYRTVQGIVRGLAEYIRMDEIHFTQLRRRIKKMCTNVRDIYNNSIGKSITLVVDASGLTTSNKGHYIEDKWKKERREYLKLHIAVDVKSKQIILFRVTKGTIHDSKKFVPMIKEISKNNNITKVYADKAYDSKTNFNLLDKMHIEPVISIRNNASGRTRKCKSRNELVHLIQNIGYEKYKQLKNTGQRWIAKVVFSSLKRVLREHLLSRKFTMQKVETTLKIMLYNRYISL
ncbi:MAG: IS5 family transposase [Nitrososphaeraceae archaeon]|nr:IS5 family transposase [Nitrososphaeraceae archaeon]